MASEPDLTEGFRQASFLTQLHDGAESSSLLGSWMIYPDQPIRGVLPEDDGDVYIPGQQAIDFLLGCGWVEVRPHRYVHPKWAVSELERARERNPLVPPTEDSLPLLKDLMSTDQQSMTALVGMRVRHDFHDTGVLTECEIKSVIVQRTPKGDLDIRLQLVMVVPTVQVKFSIDTKTGEIDHANQ